MKTWIRVILRQRRPLKQEEKNFGSRKVSEIAGFFVFSHDELF